MAVGKGEKTLVLLLELVELLATVDSELGDVAEDALCVLDCADVVLCPLVVTDEVAEEEPDKADDVLPEAGAIDADEDTLD